MSSSKCHWSKEFPVVGQGVMIFNVKRNDTFRIVISKSPDQLYLDRYDAICLEVCRDKATFALRDKDGTEKLTSKENIGLDGDRIIPYWLSYDRTRMTLKYGKGYRMTQTTLLNYDFNESMKEEKEKLARIKNTFFDAVTKRFVHVLTDDDTCLDLEHMVEFEPNPFVTNLPAMILDSSKITLENLDKAAFTFSSSLPASCLELYENIKRCDLDWSEDQDGILLSDAIRYSLNTKTCALYEKIETKKSFSSEDRSQTYLRVTLGYDYGNSPGKPYVLEIWPAGHRSPIHDHGNACAVIKVLFGSLKISIYNKQVKSEDESPLQTFNVKQGDTTWIDRNWYQTHKLNNESEDYCATIQCYSYSNSDKVHWPYFDYVTDSDTISEFTPDSDFRFIDMKKIVIAEFKSRNTKC